MKKLSLELPTMYGDHHVMEVRTILGDVPGVDAASIYASAAWQLIELKYDPAQVKPDAIRSALAKRGYTTEKPDLPPVASRTKIITEFAVGPATVERFVERVPAWSGGFGPCPGFDVLHPGEVHPADR